MSRKVQKLQCKLCHERLERCMTCSKLFSPGQNIKCPDGWVGAHTCFGECSAPLDDGTAESVVEMSKEENG